MERIERALIVILIAVAASACGDSARTGSGETSPTSSPASAASIAGKYNCVEEPPAHLPPDPSDPPDVIELRADGTATLAVKNPPKAKGDFSDTGTWSATGNTGEVSWNMSQEENPFRFTVQGSQLVFEGKPQFEVNKSTCTRVAGQSTSMAGTYTCAPDPRPTDPNWLGPETWVLAEDGKLTIRGAGDGPNDQGTQGTWRVDQDQIVINVENEEGRFDITGTSFVGVQEHPAGGKLTCAKQG